MQIHVSAAELRKLAPGEAPTARNVWRIVSNDRPRRYLSVYALRIRELIDTHARDGRDVVCGAVTDFQPGKHGEAWLVADASNVHVQRTPGDSWVSAASLMPFPLPFDSDEKP